MASIARKKLKTPEEVKAQFALRGESVRAWAIKNKFSPSLVGEILNANKARKCLRGDSHKIAVRLGLKEGEITTSVHQAI